MEVFKKAKSSVVTSFGISVFIHLGVAVAFGLWSYSGDKDFSLIKIPNSISVNLGGITARSSKAVAPKRAATISSSNPSNAPTISASPQAAAVASGSEQGTGSVTTGSGGNASGSGVGSGVEATALSAKQKYFLEFRNLVELKKEYPTMARMRGLEGIVIISVKIKSNGTVVDHKIVKESGHALLDQSALNLAKKIQQFKAFPIELGGEDIDLKFPISYKLDD